MSYNMKYVVDDRSNILIVSPTVEHKEAAKLLSGEVVGAGFVRMNKGRLRVFGESISCNVKNRGAADEEVLNEKVSMGQFS